MAVVKNLMVRCGADFRGLTKGTRRAQYSMSAMQKSANALKGALRTVGIAIGASAIVGFGRACVEAASDLQEVQNVVDATFDGMAGKVNTFAQGAITAFGLSETAAKRYSGTMGAMLKSMGLGAEASADMALALTGLTGDMASFYNLKPDVAFEKLRSGISGETEPLKQLGINMSVANMEAFAMSKGITKSWRSMTQAEQALLRYNYLMEVTGDAQGDFARTSGSWVNQTRVLSERLNQLKVALGHGLIQALTPALAVINQVMARLVAFANTFRSVTAALFGEQKAAASDSAAAVETAAEAQNDLAGGISAASKAAKQSLAGFDDLNVLQMESTAVEGVSAGAMAAVPAVSEVAVPEVETGALEKTMEPIRKALEKLKAIDLTNVTGALNRLREALVPFRETAGEGLRWLWDNVLLPLSTWTMESALPAFLYLLTEALGLASGAIERVAPYFQQLWEHILAPLAEWAGGVVVSVLEGVANALKRIGDWCNKNTGVVDYAAVTVGRFVAAWAVGKLAGGIGAAITKLGAFIAKVNLAAVAQGVMTAATAVWNGICAVASVVTTALGAAVAFLTSPIGLVVLAIGALIAVVVLLVTHWDRVKEVAGKCWEAIKSAWGKAKDWFADKITGPIAEGFKTFINGLISGVESFVNFFVRGINRIIDCVNMLSFTVPDWIPELGGKQFGFNLSHVSTLSLPRLAQGGIVDGATMATIGEAGREAVLPLENNTGWMDELADRIGGDIVIRATGEAGLMRYLNLKLERESHRRGKNLVVGGAH